MLNFLKLLRWNSLLRKNNVITLIPFEKFGNVDSNLE